MSVGNGSNSSRTNTRSLFIILFVLTLAFSLTFAGVLRSDNNKAIGIAPPAHAAKSKGSSSGGGSSSSSGGSSTSKKNEENEERQESPQEKLQEHDQPQLEQQEPVHQQEETQESPQEKLQEQQNPQLEQQEQTQLQQLEQQPPQQPVPGIITGTNPNIPTPPGTGQPMPPIGGVVPPPPPGTTLPPPICEQGSTSPECTKAPGPVPTPGGAPVDCTTNPNDPSCTTQPVDCKANPQDPSCKVDCTKNPEDPSCKVDCTKNPEDPSCHTCPKDQHFDPSIGKCVPDCPPGYHLHNGECTRYITTIITKKVITKDETVAENFITKQPTFLLLLDTAQLCQISGDTQCVAKQNQFNTLNLVTKLDSTGKTWTITGQVENRAAGKTQTNVKVTGYFYDSKGNNVAGGSYQATVNPTTLKSLQLGSFTIKASTSAMKSTPSFLRLEYQTTRS